MQSIATRVPSRAFPQTISLILRPHSITSRHLHISRQTPLSALSLSKCPVNSLHPQYRPVVFATRRSPFSSMPTSNPSVRRSPESRLDDFLGSTQSNPLTKIDFAAQKAQVQRMERLETGQRFQTSSSSGSFYKLSRFIFAFESWTITFFSGCFIYYLYNVMKYRDEKPLDIAKRMWNNFADSSGQYYDLALHRVDKDQFKMDRLRDRLEQNPNDKEAEQELAVLLARHQARAVRQEQRQKEDADANAQLEEVSNHFKAELQHMEMQQLQQDFIHKLQQLREQGQEPTDADIEAFLEEHKKQQELLAATGGDVPGSKMQSVAQQRRFN